MRTICDHETIAPTALAAPTPTSVQPSQRKPWPLAGSSGVDSQSSEGSRSAAPATSSACTSVCLPSSTLTVVTNGA